MKTYTTCVTCGELLWLLYGEGQQTHPECAEPEDYMTTALAAFQRAATVGDEAEAERWAKFIEDIDDAPPRLAESAQIYASWGWPVFPCQPGSKLPATAHGFKDASTSKSIVGRWWKETPNYNIGIATGHAFDVIDVDVPEGTSPWAEFRDSGDCPNAHGWATTPSGGWHVLIEPAGGGNLTKMAPGVDYRGLGGYVVAAPSVISESEGRRYRWSVKPSPKVVLPS